MKPPEIGEAVETAVIVSSRFCKKRLPNNSSNFSSNFSVKAGGILLAQDMVHQSTGKQLLFLSNSLSYLQSFQNQDLSHPLVAEILCRVHGLLSVGTSVVFMSVLRHVGLSGNLAPNITPTSVQFHCSSFGIQLIHTYSALKRWQLRWNSENENKLHAI